MIGKTFAQGGGIVECPYFTVLNYSTYRTGAKATVPPERLSTAYEFEFYTALAAPASTEPSIRRRRGFSPVQSQENG